jgi:hypothetical protein
MNAADKSSRKLRRKLDHALHKAERLKKRVIRLETSVRLTSDEVNAIKWFSRETNKHVYPLSASHAQVLCRLIRRWKLTT